MREGVGLRRGRAAGLVVLMAAFPQGVAGGGGVGVEVQVVLGLLVGGLVD